MTLSSKRVVRVSTILLSLVCLTLTQNSTPGPNHTPSADTKSTKHSSTVVNRRLRRPEQCPGQVIAWSHRYRTAQVRSVLQCVTLCVSQLTCVAIVFDSNSRKCYLSNDIARRDCSNMETALQGIKFYEIEIVCEAELEEPGPGGQCVCIDGYRGNPCAPYIADCDDAFKKGNLTDQGVLTIHPRLSPLPFQVYCKKMTNFTRTYLLDRRNNKLSFNRSFADYQKGFGTIGDDHWLGLEKAHQLTSSRTYELRASAKVLNGSNYFMQYQSFRISNATDGYRMWFNLTLQETYLLGDCFSPLKGAQFSAYDHDRDQAANVNCAAKLGGGWWFRGTKCSTCNPTGSLLKPSSGVLTGQNSEVFWKNGLGNNAVYKIAMYLVVLD